MFFVRRLRIPIKYSQECSLNELPATNQYVVCDKHTHTTSLPPVLYYLISNMKSLFQSACYSLHNLIFNNVVVRHSKKSTAKMQWLTTQKELFPVVFIFLSDQKVICQIRVSMLQYTILVLVHKTLARVISNESYSLGSKRIVIYRFYSVCPQNKLEQVIKNEIQD